MTSFAHEDKTKKAIQASENKCKCRHILMNHKFIAKGSEIVYGGCKECNCERFEKETK